MSQWPDIVVVIQRWGSLAVINVTLDALYVSLN